MSHLLVCDLGSERIHPLTEPEILIGRSRKNHIRLHGEQSSRYHCKIVLTAEGGYRVLDLDSANGIHVNGQKVAEKGLVDGDSISVGQATIIFRDGEPEGAPPDSPTVPIPLQDRNVKILLRTVTSAFERQDLESFLPEAVDNVIEIAQAERGILFAREPDGRLRPLVARDREHRPIDQLDGMSRTIPRQVDESGKAIYLLDSHSGKDISQSKSVSIYQLRTVMCAPLRVGERRLGVLYVDSRAKSREFTAADLAIFEAVANYLALAMDKLRASGEEKARVEERRRALEHENALLRAALEARRHLIGECPSMRALYENVRKAAPTDATILLLGESGTGKEAIAHVLHDLSPRSERPFVVIDGASIPETLLESELFGYEKGAFTGAAARKPGKFETAEGGTVFLDEIAELPPGLQAKLLRVLEQRTLTRVGGVDPVRVDFRLVAATNRNLEERVRQGGFRQDLYFRLKVVTLELPPLRERGDDLLLLADHFLTQAHATHDRPIRGFSDEARAALRAHRWEGNVRELKHRVEQAVILTGNEYISTEDLNLPGAAGLFQPLEAARDLFEKTYLLRALGQNHANVTHSARALGISRQHLQNLIKKYNIQRTD